tara:strand:- start:889 stop:1362 length:474 start_codon:yes stop_codon:yes gene_type:complete
MEFDPNNLHWSKYLSYYIFLWFIMYQYGLIQYNPSILCGICILYAIYKFLMVCLDVLKSKKKIQINFKIIKIVLLWLTHLVILDVIPYFLIQNKYIDNNSLIFTIIFVLLYIFLMKYLYNYNIKDIINIYNTDFTNFLDMSLTQFIVQVFPILKNIL